MTALEFLNTLSYRRDRNREDERQLEKWKRMN